MKKRKKPQKSYRRDVENGGDSGGRRKKRSIVSWIPYRRVPAGVMEGL